MTYSLHPGTLLGAVCWLFMKATGADMTPYETKRAIASEFILAVVVIAGGLAIAGVSLMQLSARQHESVERQVLRREMAQVAPSPPQTKDSVPAESMPGGTRPTTPAPEPARPDADAQKAGAVPALPPAPAEKMGEPIKK